MEDFKAPVPVEYNNQLVLLTAQLAEYYGCSVEHIRDNFRKNRGRFIEGKHYFKIEGDDLKAFRNYTENFSPVEKSEDDGMFPIVPARTPSLYLWTERGAARHAKSLSNDKAWDVFELLRESYFSKNTSAPALHIQPQEKEGGSAENPVQIFEHEQFGKIRVVVINGVPYFVGIDVARALGYKNGSRDVNRHVDKSDRVEYRLFFPAEAEVPDGTPGQTRKVTLINKSGVYSLILDSQLPKAKEFRHWVTSEVLEAIDKTGSYSIVDKPKAKSKPAPNPRRRAAQLRDSHVYAFLMSDNTVKIGVAGDVEVRKPQIERKYNLTVVNYHYSPLMTRKDALHLETTCKKILSPYRTEGEFFSVNFITACAIIDSYSKILDERSDFNRAEKILTVASMMADSPEKQRLLIVAGKFIADEKFT